MRPGVRQARNLSTDADNPTGRLLGLDCIIHMLCAPACAPSLRPRPVVYPLVLDATREPLCRCLASVEPASITTSGRYGFRNDGRILGERIEHDIVGRSGKEYEGPTSVRCLCFGRCTEYVWSV